MKKYLPLFVRGPCLVSMIVAFLLVQGCSIKLVADYDAELSREIINVSKQVDQFYGDLIETSTVNRSYDKFKDRYIKIEVNIRSLIVQNKARTLNEESISIAEITLEKWLKYKDAHQKNDSYKDTLAKNHRKRFTRLFTAMLVAEEAKKLDTEDSENAGEDQ